MVNVSRFKPNPGSLNRFAPSGNVLGRFGPPSSLMPTSMPHVPFMSDSSQVQAVGMRGVTMRRGGAGGLGFSQARSSTPQIRASNPFRMNFRMDYNPLSFGSSSPKTSGRSKTSRTTRNAAGNPIRQLIAMYGRIPTEMRKEVRQVLKVGGMSIKRRAEWYWRASSRAQRAIKIQTSLGWKNAGTRVWVDNSIMPFNRAWERINGQQYYMHIPWGNTAAAQQRPNRPGLRPATKDVSPKVVKQMEEAIQDIARRFQQGKI